MQIQHPDRQALRKSLIAAREALPADERRRLEAALLEHLASLLDSLSRKTLAFCWPFRGEPDLSSLVATWLAADATRRAALPVVIDQEKPLMFRSWTPQSRLEPDRYGIPTPLAGEILTPDLLLIPVNGFDARGFRLGYGGGYFDRTIESLDPLPLTVGYGFELSRLEHIEEGAHDRPLDWIVTEVGASDVGSSRHR